MWARRVLALQARWLWSSRGGFCERILSDGRGQCPSGCRVQSVGAAAYALATVWQKSSRGAAVWLFSQPGRFTVPCRRGYLALRV